MNDQEENAHAPEETDAQACDTCDNKMHDNQIIALTSTDAGNSTDNAAEDAKDADAYETPDDDASQRTTPPIKPTGDYNVLRGHFQHDLFAERLIEECHICHVNTPDGQLVIWDESAKRYRQSDRAIYRAMSKRLPPITRNQKKETLEYMLDQAPIREEADGSLIQFRNGVLDINTGEVIDPTPDLLIMNTIPHDYKPETDTQEAGEILDQYANGDESIKRNLCEAMGVSMSRVKFSQCIVFIGTGANGKSTYLDMLQNVLGEENCSAVDIHHLHERFQIAHVAGKLANINDDISPDYTSPRALGQFKKIVTGDTIGAEIKNGGQFEFRSYATYIIAANDYPEFGDTSEGMSRRLHPIPFNRIFPLEERDPTIPKRIKTEEFCEQLIVLGIEALKAMNGCEEFTPNTYSAQMRADIMEGSDTFRQWTIDEDITIADVYEKAVNDVYDRYKLYCDDSSARPLDKRRFTMRVTQLFPTLISQPRSVPSKAHPGKMTSARYYVLKVSDAAYRSCDA